MQICARSPFRSALLLLAVLGALAIAACGDDSSGSSDSGPDPAAATPADAPIYAEAVVRPGQEQNDSLMSGMSKLLGQEDPGTALRGALNDALGKQDFNYEEDIQPWLAPTMGGFAANLDAEQPTAALVMGVTDEGAAQDALDKVAETNDVNETQESYNGTDYTLTEDGSAWALVGDYLVAGSEEGVKASIDAVNGDSLADNSAAAAALSSAPDDSLFRAYFDTPALLDALVKSGQLSKSDVQQLGDQLSMYTEEPVVVSGAADADSISLEASGPAGPDSSSTAIVSGLPGGSWFALGAPNVGEAISLGYEQYVQALEASLGAQGLNEQLDVPQFDIRSQIEQALGIDLSKDLAWAGDLGLFVQGTSPLDIGAGLVIETDDEAAATKAIGKLGAALSKQRAILVKRTDDGFTVQPADGTPITAEVAVRDGKVVVAGGDVTVDDLLSPAQTLADSDSFKTASGALGDGLSAALYLDMPTLLQLLTATGVDQDPGFQSAAPYLSAISYVIAGGGTDGDRAVTRFVVGLQERTSTGGGSTSGTTAAAIVP